MPEPPAAPHPDTRLNGWKEIATHLGKGVRTVQRWEKVYGLPVHRIGDEGGEIVFAFAREIGAWLDEFEHRRRSGAIVDESGPSPTSDVERHRDEGADLPPGADRDAVPFSNEPAREPDVRVPRRVVPLAVIGALVLTLAVAAGVAWSRRGPQAGREAAQPAAWRVDPDTLVVLDGQGRELWRHAFDFDLQESGFAPNAERDLIPLERGSIEIADLDNDGTREVVFAARSTVTDRAGLYVFNADGTIRFEHHPAPTVKTADQTYSPPLQVRGFVLTRNADSTRTIWVVFIHHIWFPSRLDQLDANGTVLSSYMSNGYIGAVDVGTWQGQPAVFVGATNNEHRGASLAIFRGEHVRGSAPAANANYRCTNCGAGGPDAFIVFPRSCIRLIRDEQSDVTRTQVDADGRLLVMVLQGREPIPPSEATIGVPAYYEISAALDEASVEISRELGLMHKAVRAQGRLDHDLGARDQALLLPLLKWDDGRFVPLRTGEMRR